METKLYLEKYNLGQRIADLAYDIQMSLFKIIKGQPDQKIILFPGDEKKKECLELDKEVPGKINSISCGCIIPFDALSFLRQLEILNQAEEMIYGDDGSKKKSKSYNFPARVEEISKDLDKAMYDLLMDQPNHTFEYEPFNDSCYKQYAIDAKIKGQIVLTVRRGLGEFAEESFLIFNELPADEKEMALNGIEDDPKLLDEWAEFEEQFCG